MAEEHEIHAKLTLDDAAGAALEHIKGGFEHVGEKAREVQHELGAMLRQTLATAAGFQLSGMVDTMKEFGHEVFAAATESEEQVKSLAGLIAMTDKTGMSFEDTTERAAGLKDELEDIGIKSGVSADQVIDAFETIATRSQKSTDEIREMTEQMALAGRALPGGVQTLAAAYRDLESGIVRPRNAIVQLIKQTGTAHGSAKDIAKSLSGMVQAGQMDKAFDLANVAIGKMSEKMKTAPLTFKEVVQSIKDIRANIYESMGLPLLKAITPQLERLRVVLMQNRGAIEEFAQAAMVNVAVWVPWAANKIAEGFKYIQTHAEAIERAFMRGADFVKKAFEFVVAHKEEIAIALGARSAAKVGMGAAPLIGGAIKGIGAMGGMGGEGLMAFAGAAPELAIVLPGLIIAATAAAGAFDIITDSTSRYNRAANEMWSSIQADFSAAFAGVAGDFGELKVSFKALADLAGMELLGQLRAIFWAAKEMRAAFDYVNKPVMELGSKLARLLGIAATDQDVGLEEARRRRGDGGQFDRTGGIEWEPDKVRILGKEMASKGVNLNFTGAINIKQDFRDQDPDRIAVIFRQDLAKNATNAMGAVFGTPRGAL